MNTFPILFPLFEVTITKPVILSIYLICLVVLSIFVSPIFDESALRPIQSTSGDVCLYVCMSHPGNDASQWTRDLWSKGVSLILAYLN